MSKKVTWLNSDNLWYVSVHNDAGDFSKHEGPYPTLEKANSCNDIPESTPAGEIVSDKEVVVSFDEATGKDTVLDENVTEKEIQEKKEELIESGELKEELDLEQLNKDYDPDLEVTSPEIVQAVENQKIKSTSKSKK
jgi:hypothetical protein